MGVGFKIAIKNFKMYLQSARNLPVSSELRPMDASEMVYSYYRFISPTDYVNKSNTWNKIVKKIFPYNILKK